MEKGALWKKGKKFKVHSIEATLHSESYRKLYARLKYGNQRWESQATSEKKSIRWEDVHLFTYTGHGSLEVQVLYKILILGEKELARCAIHLKDANSSYELTSPQGEVIGTVKVHISPVSVSMSTRSSSNCSEQLEGNELEQIKEILVQERERLDKQEEKIMKVLAKNKEAHSKVKMEKDDLVAIRESLQDRETSLLVKREGIEAEKKKWKEFREQLDIEKKALIDEYVKFRQSKLKTFTKQKLLTRKDQKLRNLARRVVKGEEDVVFEELTDVMGSNEFISYEAARAHKLLY